MNLALSNHTVGGMVSGEIREGIYPLPWLLIPVIVPTAVWDRYGNKTIVRTKVRVAIQGKENSTAIKAQVKEGCSLLATGQDVPAYAVCNNPDIKGNVVLAVTCQVFQECD